MSKAKRKPTRVKPSNPRYQYILVSPSATWASRFPKVRITICADQASLVQTAGGVTKDAIWISETAGRTEKLTKILVGSYGNRHGTINLGRLLTLESPEESSLTLLSGWFGEIIGASPSLKMLPKDELAEVLGLPKDKRRDLFIAGSVNESLKCVTLYRGDLSTVVVPFDLFRPSGTSKPNFRHPSLGNYGNTIRFGDYESTADIILWHRDADYRKRMQEREKNHAKGIGASLRRLRIQRGFTQSDFPSISRKTISRIENGEITHPQAKTLKIVARRLGVKPDEIDTY